MRNAGLDVMLATVQWDYSWDWEGNRLVEFCSNLRSLRWAAENPIYIARKK